MAGSKISALTELDGSAGNIPASGDFIPIVDTSAGATKKIDWAIASGGMYNVRAYGATGDGVTDDTAAIQAAIDTGYPIVLSNGYTYVCDNLIPPTSGKIVIIAETIDTSNPPKLKSVTTATNSALLLTNHSGNIDLTVRGIHIDDYNIGINCGSSFAGEIEVDIQDCKITNCHRGIHINCNCTIANIHRNTITDCTSSTDSCWAIALGELAGGYTATTGKFFVSNNYIKTVRSTDTAASVESHGVYCKGWYPHITDNYIEDVGSPNSADANGGEAIYTVSPFSKIINNNIVDGCYGGEGAIVVKGDRGTTGSEGYSTEIAFNTLKASSTGKLLSGINTASVDDIYIHHNTIDGVAWAGYYNGVHTGSSNVATLYDGTAPFVTDALIGLTVYNQTDSSYGTITDNTTTDVTATLAGGTDNDWDAGDAYIIIGLPASSIGDCTAIFTDNTSSGRNIRIEHNNIYNFQGVNAIQFRAAGRGHSVSFNNIHFKGVTDTNVTVANAIRFALGTTGATEGLSVIGNTVEFDDSVTSNVSTIIGINWVTTQTTHDGMKWLYNTVILDDQTKDTGGGAQSTIAFNMGDHASQVFTNCMIAGNTALGSHDTDWSGSPATGTHVDSLEWGNSWNFDSSAAWMSPSNQAYTVSNLTPGTDRVLDCTADDLDNVAFVLGTLINDLKARGILG